MSKAPYRYKDCIVDRVIDGDTVDLRINLGFSIFVKKRIRFHGIDAWESRTRDLEEKAKGMAAKKRLKELLVGGKCDLESHALGKYGRVIGVILVDDQDINQLLVEEGHAKGNYFGGKR